MLYYTPDNLVKWLRNIKKYQDRNIIVSDKINPPEKSISICTTCMNRLHDLEYTLPKNIQDNRGYRNLEFVLLDYNSSDGLGDWVKSNMMRHINSGRLVYYRTEHSEFFHPNHSRNVSFKLAKNDLIANVDSDNFTHKDFAKRLNQCASVADDSIIILPDNFLLPDTNRCKLKGRFALYKKDIERMNGFDEDLDDGFGNDDLNFVFRAFIYNFKLIRYESKYTEGRLETKNSERVKFTVNKNYEEGREHNYEIMLEKICRGQLDVNRDHDWGKAVVVKNFKEKIEL